MTAHEHVFDDLPGLLAGELDRADTDRVCAHLRTCDDCRQDLVLTVSASAALRSAARFAPRAVMDADEVLPDPTLFLAELAAERGGPVGEVHPGEYGPHPDELPALPDLGGPGPGEPGPFGGAGGLGGAGRPADRSGEARPAARHRSGSGTGTRRRTWWTAAAAAVLLVVGVGAGVLIGRDRTPPGRQIALRSVGAWTATGTVTMRGNQMEVDTANLPAPPAGHYYELWLVNPDGPNLVSVGTLDHGVSTLTVSDALLASHTTVEISYEALDGNADFSGDGVLSGRYS